MIYPMECVLPNSGRHRPLDASQSNEFEQWFEQANTPSKPAFKKKLDKFCKEICKEQSSVELLWKFRQTPTKDRHA